MDLPDHLRTFYVTMDYRTRNKDSDDDDDDDDVKAAHDDATYLNS